MGRVWKTLARSETLVWAGFVLIMVAVFARTMAEDLRHDEQMFVPAGAMLGRLSLYSDFNYGHLPDLPLLLGGLYGLTGTDHFLLFARLVTLLAWAGMLICTYLLAFQLTKERPIAVIAAVFLATNSVLVSHVGVVASNNFIPLVFPILAFYLFFAGLEGREPKPLHILAAGLCLSTATGFKVSSIAAIPPFALFAFLVPGHVSFPTRLIKVVLPLAVGGVIGALPIFYYLAVDADAFLFNTLEYHVGPQRTYWALPEHAAEVSGLTLASRIFYAYRLWFFGSTVMVVLASLYVFVALSKQHRSQAFDVLIKSWTVVLAGLLLTLAIVMSLIVKPSFPQYYMPPIPFAVIFAVCLYALLSPALRKSAQPVFVSLAIGSAVLGGPYLLQDLPKLIKPAKWAGVSVHRTGVQVAQALQREGARGTLLATHNPVYALEGGLTVYPELATGSFFYRIGDVITPEQRDRFKVGSASSLAETFDRNPPDGILVGYEGALDAALIAYAETRGYRKLPDTFGSDRYGTGTLYVRSGS